MNLLASWVHWDKSWCTASNCPVADKCSRHMTAEEETYANKHSLILSFIVPDEITTKGCSVFVKRRASANKKEKSK